MKKVFLNLLIIAVLAGSMLLSGCSKDSDNSEPESSNNGQANADAKETGTSKKDDEEETLYQELFDINNFVSISIDISNEELQKIQDDYAKYTRMQSKSPIYRKASKVTIKVNDKTYEIEDVGVRMKGNTSRVSFYSESLGVYDIIHLKLSFNETFEDKDIYGDDAVEWTDDAAKKERKNRTFATLDGIDLKWNRGYDRTYIREYYSYAMFRDFGVLAPNVSPAAVSVNDKNWGVFNLYEPVNKSFIKRNTKDTESVGDLYKAAWTNDPAAYIPTVTYGINDEDTAKFYNYDLKTNKKTSEHEALTNLISTLNSGKLTKDEFDSVIDAKNFAYFAAVSYFSGSPDDLRNNYNNHYVYFSSSTKKAMFIPYDYDTAIGNSSDWDPSGSAMTNVDPFSTMAIGNSSTQRNPIFIYSILKQDGFCYNDYKKALEEVATSKWMDYENFKKTYNIVESLYKDYAIPEVEFRNINKDRLSFTLDSSYESGDNMAVEEYMTKILETYKNAVK